MAQEKDSRHIVTKVLIFQHGCDALVAQRWRLSAPGDWRVPRIVARIRGCVVEAVQEGSAVNGWTGMSSER